MTDQEPKPGDIRPPQRQALEEQERLADILEHLDEDEGRFQLEGRKVVYMLNASADDDIDELRPGQWMNTTDLGLTGESGGTSLSVWVWEGVPTPFKKVVLCHEVTEGLLKLQHGMKKHDAHLVARAQHEKYARAHLTPEQLTEFAEWDARLEHGSSEGEDE